MLFKSLLKYLETDFYNPTIFTSPAQATKMASFWLQVGKNQLSFICVVSNWALAE